MSAIIVSACGTGNGFAYCEAINNNFPDQKLIGLDINPKHLNASSVYCTSYYQVDKVTSDKFLEQISELIRSHKPKLYIALLDMEFRLVQEICRENSVKLIGIDDPSLLEDKFKYLGLLHDAGVAIPKMASCIENIDWNAKLYIKKPRLGFGSIGTQVGKVSELNDTSDCFIQEYLDGKEVTVDCFYDSNTQFVYSVTRDRIETKLGVTTKSKVYFDQQLHQVCSGIMKALKLDGGACIQFINSSNRWRVIDVNPRLGAGSKISTRCGADFFSATIAYNLGLSYHKYFNRTAQQANYVVRQYQEIITQ